MISKEEPTEQSECKPTTKNTVERTRRHRTSISRNIIFALMWISYYLRGFERTAFLQWNLPRVLIDDCVDSNACLLTNKAHLVY